MTQAVDQTLVAVEKGSHEIRTALDKVWEEVAKTRTRPPTWIFAVEKAHEKMADAVLRAKTRAQKVNDKAARKAAAVKVK